MNFSEDNYKRGQKSPDRQLTSNHEKQFSYEERSFNNHPINKKFDESRFGKITLRKSISEKEVKTDIYVLEGQDNYEILKSTTRVSYLASARNNSFRELLMRKV